jgi:hypothetical protein
VKARWVIVVCAICLAVAIATYGILVWRVNAYNQNTEVSAQEAMSVLNQAVTYAQARDLDKLCDLSGSKLMCQHQWEWAGGAQVVPSGPPQIVDTYLLPTVHLKNGTWAPGGRVLVVEGADGLGRSYRTDFFIFRSGGDWGLDRKLAAINVIYWSGARTGQVNEDGTVTTSLSANPKVE